MKKYLALTLLLWWPQLHAQEAVLDSPNDPTDKNSDWTMPRTEYGYPDLQGTWLFGSRTPFQRPPKLGTKATYSNAEVVELERKMRQRNLAQDEPLSANRGAPEKGARIGQEADDAFLAHFREAKMVKTSGEYRTSVISHPTNGRLPKQVEFRDFHAQRRAAGLGDTDGPEGQPLSGRCLMFGAAVPSLTPIMMNANLQIVQTKDYVVIMTEMAHDARIIRIDQAHFTYGHQSWMGDSVGYWDGDTLVVRTINFRPEQSSARSVVISEEFELEERYTLVADGAINYGFTATDAKAYTESFSGERTLTRNRPDEQIFEFACHEGNYSLSGILAGARRLEGQVD